MIQAVLFTLITLLVISPIQAGNKTLTVHMQAGNQSTHTVNNASTKHNQKDDIEVDGFIIIGGNNNAFQSSNILPSSQLISQQQAPAATLSQPKISLVINNAWITQNRHIGGFKYYKYLNRSKESPKDNSVEIPLYCNEETEFTEDDYSNAQRDATHQYWLNHHHHGSYHKRVQYAAHVAHILFKKTDRNPATQKEEKVKNQHKKPKNISINDTPQYSLKQPAPRTNNKITIAVDSKKPVSAEMLNAPVAFTSMIIVSQLWGR